MIASTDTGLVEMRVNKVVAFSPGRSEDISYFVVLDEAQGARHVVILIGLSEALELAASLQGLRWGRPMTCQLRRSPGAQSWRPGAGGPAGPDNRGRVCRHRGG